MNPNVKILQVKWLNPYIGKPQGILEYDYSKFPGGEIHVCLLNYMSDCDFEITASICSSDDLMTVLLLNDALKNRSVGTKVSLRLKYIPYGQQDRVCEAGEALSIKVFANLINSCGFESVIVYDPHSYVSTGLINNCRIIEVTDIFADSEVRHALESVDVLVAPDAGAYKKVLNVSRFGDIPVVHATKERINGEVQSVKLHGDVTGKNCLVIDDICVGGRTFTELGKALKDAGAGDLSLYVTHGIFSKGLDELNLYYSKIYSTDSRPEAVKLGEEKKIDLVKL